MLNLKVGSDDDQVKPDGEIFSFDAPHKMFHGGMAAAPGGSAHGFMADDKGWPCLDLNRRDHMAALGDDIDLAALTAIPHGARPITLAYQV